MAEIDLPDHLALAMVQDGQAFVYLKYLAQCDTSEYLDAEFYASRRCYGVWQVLGGITRPWDFRRSRTSGRSGGESGSVPGGRQ